MCVCVLLYNNLELLLLRMSQVFLDDLVHRFLHIRDPQWKYNRIHVAQVFMMERLFSLLWFAYKTCLFPITIIYYVYIYLDCEGN